MTSEDTTGPPSRETLRAVIGAAKEHKQAAEAADEARDKRNEAIRRALNDGHSMRAVGQAAGITAAAVHKISSGD